MFFNAYLSIRLDLMLMNLWLNDHARSLVHSLCLSRDMGKTNSASNFAFICRINEAKFYVVLRASTITLNLFLFPFLHRRRGAMCCVAKFDSLCSGLWFGIALLMQIDSFWAHRPYRGLLSQGHIPHIRGLWSINEKDQIAKSLTN